MLISILFRDLESIIQCLSFIFRDTTQLGIDRHSRDFMTAVTESPFGISGGPISALFKAKSKEAQVPYVKWCDT